MNRKLPFRYVASVGLSFYAVVAFAQETPARNTAPVKPNAAPTWRTLLMHGGLAENGFHSQLRIRLETRPDGTRVAIVTNVSKVALSYEGDSPTAPRLFTEEWQAGKWIATEWESCGTGIRSWDIPPGASGTLALPGPKPNKDKKTRYWVIFTNSADKERSLMLLDDKPDDQATEKETVDVDTDKATVKRGRPRKGDTDAQ